MHGVGDLRMLKPYQQVLKFFSIIQNLIGMISIWMMLREEFFNTTTSRPVFVAEGNFSNHNSKLIRLMPNVTKLLNPFRQNLIIFLKKK